MKVIKKKAHKHQKEIRKIIRNLYESRDTRGQITVPTGGGKTLNEAWAIIDFFKCNKGSVACILDPRIGLSIQVMKEVVKEVILDGSFNNTRFIACHSAGLDDNYLIDLLRELGITGLRAKQFTNTTSTAELSRVVEKAKKKGENVLIASTYHSADKVACVDVDLLVADESHWLVTNGFCSVIDTFAESTWLFFTATQRFTKSENGLGMNNSSRFGNVIASISSTELIRRGIIVPPRLAIIRGRGANNNEFKDTLSNLVFQMKLQAKSAAFFGCPKVIVCAEEVPQAKGFYDHYLSLQKKGKLPKGFKNVAMISSDHGCLINGVKMDRRDEFLAQINSSTEGFMIFHYDILSEGIDIDGISGVCILRNMDVVKFIQTIGRALRVLVSDKALPISDRKKKYGLITIPLIENSKKDHESLKEELRGIIQNIRAGGFEPPFVILDEPEGRSDEEVEFDELFEEEVNIEKLMTTKNLKALEDVEIEIEKEFIDSEKDARMTKLMSINDFNEFLMASKS